MSTLRQLIRQKFNNRVKPLYIGEECEMCGCKENLTLHHETFLCIITNNVLNYLRIEEKETLDQYEPEVVYQIVSCILAEHLKITYKTLCKDCHVKIHETCTSKRFNGCGAEYYKDTWALTDKQIEYLDLHLNMKRYNKETFWEIVKVLECKDEYGRLCSNVEQVNEWFEHKGVPYFIEMGKELNRNCKKFGCRYYIVRLL